MQNILSDLFNGKIIPWERKYPLDAATLSLLDEIGDTERFLLHKIPKENRERFRQLSEQYGALGSMTEEKVFCYGFRLGMLMMLDVMG